MSHPKTIEVLTLNLEMFKDELGTLCGIKAKKREINPRFYKSCLLPFAMKSRVDAELDRLEKAGIIMPIKHREWAVPVVPIMKWGNTIHLCGDYKLTVNQAAAIVTYPVPQIEELIAPWSGGIVLIVQRLILPQRTSRSFWMMMSQRSCWP